MSMSLYDMHRSAIDPDMGLDGLRDALARALAQRDEICVELNILKAEVSR